MKDTQGAEIPVPYETLLEAVGEGIVLLDGSQRICYVNKQAGEWLGRKRSELSGVPLHAVLPDPAQKKNVSTQLEKAKKRGVIRFALRLPGKKGNPVHLRVTQTVIRNKEGGGNSILLLLTDVSSYKTLEQELRKLQVHDEATGLYSQRYFFEQLNMNFEHWKRYNRELSVVLFRINGMKPFRDEYGTDVAETFMSKLSHSLKEQTRGSDVLCRFDIDVLGLLTFVPSVEFLELVMERLYRTLQSKMEELIKKLPVVMSVSAGATSTLLKKYKIPREMLQDAKKALRSTKPSKAKPGIALGG
ncbi:MAG: diguanylate cyclase [Acidobacteriota bacterium]|nr:MAG: diguanylate cyclase [Acidobacteriota bacterium]